MFAVKAILAWIAQQLLVLDSVVCYGFAKQYIMPIPLSAIANNITVAPVSGTDSEINKVTEVMGPFEKLSPGPFCGKVNRQELTPRMK